MRVLVTGASGVVGAALRPRLAACYPDCLFVDRVPAADLGTLATCDLASPNEVAALMASARPEVVLHLAGNKDVFSLERTPELAARANVETTKNVLASLRGTGAFFAYLSTDYVFEGVQGPYDERAPTEPTTVYGRSKLAAERLVRDGELPAAVVRSSSLYGYPDDFVAKVDQTLASGTPFPAFVDLVSNPTSVPDLFEMLCRIVDRRLVGTFHASGSEALSREAFARRIAAALSLDGRLIQPERKSDRIRPPDLSLDNAWTRATLDYAPASIEDVLRSRPVRSPG